jgi:hypothetical protein
VAGPVAVPVAVPVPVAVAVRVAVAVEGADTEGLIVGEALFKGVEEESPVAVGKGGEEGEIVEEPVGLQVATPPVQAGRQEEREGGG